MAGANNRRLFGTILLNVVVAMNFSVVAWSAIMSVYAIVSKAALFLTGYATMRYIGARRRARSAEASARA